MKRKCCAKIGCCVAVLILAMTAAGCAKGKPSPRATETATGTEAGTIAGTEAGTVAGTVQAPPDDRNAVYEALIESLEARLLQEKTDRYISDSTYDETIAALQAQLDKLRGDARSVSADPETREAATNAPSDPPAPTHISETDTQAAAPAEATPTSLRYSVSDGEVTIHAFLGGEPDLVIPAVINGYPVTSIADDAMRGADITSVILPDTVREIGWFAFADCPALKTVTLPASLTSIGYGAFSGCPSLTVTCPAGTYADTWAKSYGLVTRPSDK